MKDLKNWKKEFDELFCREDGGPEKRGKMDSWFLQDYITGKEVKAFIASLLEVQKTSFLEIVSKSEFIAGSKLEEPVVFVSSLKSKLKEI